MAETVVTRLQAQECQGLLVNPRRYEKQGRVLPCGFQRHLDLELVASGTERRSMFIV